MTKQSKIDRLKDVMYPEHKHRHEWQQFINETVKLLNIMVDPDARILFVCHCGAYKIVKLLRLKNETS